jgi:hypothetical protein
MRITSSFVCRYTDNTGRKRSICPMCRGHDVSGTAKVMTGVRERLDIRSKIRMAEYAKCQSNFRTVVPDRVAEKAWRNQKVTICSGWRPKAARC